MPPALAPLEVEPLVPDALEALLLSELLGADELVAAEPVPEDDPDMLRVALGPVELHAASASAHARGMIHLVI